MGKRSDHKKVDELAGLGLGQGLSQNRQPVYPGAAKVEEATGTTGTEADKQTFNCTFCPKLGVER